MSILIAGHYCHDTLLSANGEHRALGGSAAYASAVLEGLRADYRVVAKVGADFRHAREVLRPPRVVASARTTSFIDDYRYGERRSTLTAACEPIFAADLDGAFDFGISCAIAGEMPAETLAKLRSICGVVLADAQALLRGFDADGAIVLQPLPEGLERHLDYLKASRAEAALLDVASLRRRLTLIVTDGARGSTVLSSDRETHVPPFAALEVDATGAGDCFLAGFAAGLQRGWDAIRAARLGSACGAVAVGQIGIPPPAAFSHLIPIVWSPDQSRQP